VRGEGGWSDSSRLETRAKESNMCARVTVWNLQRGMKVKDSSGVVRGVGVWWATSTCFDCRDGRMVSWVEGEWERGKEGEGSGVCVL